MSKTVYDFSVKDQKGTDISLETYKGQVLLIVNTATGCGLTPQYQALEEFYQAYQDQGFQILDFPCNQFGNQTPGTAAEINDFCQLHYQTSFPRFAKIDVKGSAASPLYRWLTQQKTGFLSADIKWNFTKFLLDRDGQVIKRYAPTKQPADLAKDIEKLL